MVDEGPTGVKAPDGGWGWAVLLGGFVITGFSYAFPKAISVFFKELMHEFGIGYSDTAWISSILLAMLYGTGAWPQPRRWAGRGWALRSALPPAVPRRPALQRVCEPLRLPASHAGGRPAGVPGHGGRVLLPECHPALPHGRGPHW